LPQGLIYLIHLTILLFDNLPRSGRILFFIKMTSYYDLPVFRDTYTFIMKIFGCTIDFSKEYKKYTVGQDIKRDTLQW